MNFFIDMGTGKGAMEVDFGSFVAVYPVEYDEPAPGKKLAAWCPVGRKFLVRGVPNRADVLEALRNVATECMEEIKKTCLN